MRVAVVLSLGLSGLASFVSGDARAQTVTAASAVEHRPDGSASKPSGAVADLATPQASDHAPSNPLWAIPLAQLKVTRERPLFSPSRRPPPPVEISKAAPPPPPPPEPEKLQLSLVGTVVSTDGEGIGVFLSLAGIAPPLRLKTGDIHKGWVLRAVRRREAEFGKDQQVALLKLPVREPKPAHQISEDSSRPRPVASSAAPPASPPSAPADRATEAANPTTSQATSTDSAPVANVRKSGFRRPEPSEGEQPPRIDGVLIRPLAIVSSPPPVNPLAREWH
jgi:general secretion pathway protein N